MTSTPPPYSEGMDDRKVFQERWDSLYAMNQNKWRRNPWVWVIGFELLSEGRENG